MTVLDLQCGVLTFAQARAFMTRAQIRAHVDARRWQRPHRGVLVTHNGRLTREQELWVCLLAAPPDSALAGPTAAELDGLRGFESERIWLLVPKGQRLPSRDGVIVKSSASSGRRTYTRCARLAGRPSTGACSTCAAVHAVHVPLAPHCSPLYSSGSPRRRGWARHWLGAGRAFDGR